MSASKKGTSMNNRLRVVAVLALVCAAVFGARLIAANTAAAASDVVTMTVTAVGKKDTAPPAIKQEDVQLTLGKEKKQLAGWTKVEKLYLAVLVDDALDSSAAAQWSDVKEFLSGQPDSTYEMVAYARNATAMVAQDFTNDHALAAKALRIPMGNIGAFGSAYLSLLDLMKRWQGSGDRRSILLISSGIDYFRGDGYGIKSPDLDSVIGRAQKGNINIWSIYYPGMGHRSRSLFRATSGQWNLSELADETGAESYYLGTSAPVSFKPYLDEIQTHLSNQYLLAFAAGASGGKKGKFERARVSTELENVEFLHANQVFLPAAP
jgi:hypothetical protein